MSRFTRISLFPDVNVWLALESTDEQIFFCRFTQITLLRLLTNQQVMGVDARNQNSAEDERMELHREPEQPEREHAAGLTIVTFDQGFRSLALVSRVLSP